MIKFLKQGIIFIKKNPGLLYSLFLILVIPLALYYNTFSTVKSFQQNIDLFSQTNALLVESVFSILSSDILTQPQILQKKVEKISEENPDISQLRVIIPLKGKKFQILASRHPEEKGKKIKGDPLHWAWYKNQAMAYLNVNEKGERFWEIIRPIRDLKGNKIALVSMDFSLKESDALIIKAIHRSYFITILAIILVLFLIIHHTFLFKYPLLVRKLREVDKMKDEFIRMAVHELQSPIINIRGYAQALKEEISPLLNEIQKKYFFRLDTSSQRLSALISDMLQVSRIEQGRISFLPEKISPPQIIKEIVEELKPKAQEKKLEIIFEEKLEPFYIKVNSNRLKEILYNLIDNAIKYTFEGKIEIKTHIDQKQKRYYILVQDSGIGIPAEARRKLFSKFYRVKTKETAEISGTGLGLWIVKTLANKMGGDILVESMKGVGSKFLVFFPLFKK